MFVEIAMYCTTLLVVGLIKDKKNKKEKKPDGATAIKIEPHVKPLNAVIQEDSHSLEEEYNTYINLNLAAFLSGVGSKFFIKRISPVTALLFGISSFPFNEKAVQSLKERKLSSETLIALAGFLGGVVTGNIYIYALWEAVYFIGKKKLLTSKQNFRQSLHNLFETSDDRITIIVNDQEILIPISEINKGDIISVKTGEVIPADGFIENGIALIDQKYLTGEAQPVEKSKGSAIYASTHVVSGTIHVRVEETGQETIIKKVNHILNHSIDYKLDMLSRGEKLMEQATVPIFIAGSIALPLRGVTGGSAVYGSTPGYDLVLFAPLAMLRYIELASKHGLFVKDARAMEMFAKIDTFIFDKTGTLTHDHLEVGEIFCFENFREDEILFYASLSEQNMSHPIAEAITAKALQRGVLIPRIDQAQYTIGFGVSVNYEDKTILVGSKRFLLNEKINIPDDMNASLIRISSEGHSLVYVAMNDLLIGIIEIRSSIREEAKRVVRFLSEHKTCDIMIMSGDQENPTKKIAMEMDIETCYFEVLPENKAEIIKELQKKGKKVCFIGDGINDTLAMKQADLSISLCNNNKIAQDIAQIIILDNNLNSLELLSDLSKRSNSNLSLSYFYSVAPVYINTIGVFLLNFGNVTTTTLEILLFLAGLINSMGFLESTENTTPKLLGKADSLSTDNR